MRRAVIAAAVAAGIAALGAAPASATEFRVDDDKAQCPDAQYTTIQSAVVAAGPNDTVKVCPGTYAEQVRITGSQKDGLKLESLKPKQAIIQAPQVMTSPRAIVLIDGADRVTVRGFVIRGPFTLPSCGAPLPEDPSLVDTHRGVYVRNGFKEVIRHNHITLVRNVNPALFGCQDGISVQIGRRAEGNVGSARVTDNLIDEYQKGGVVVDGEGSFGEIDHNVIRAAEEVQPSIAPNGVQVSRGAGAEVDHNRVSQNRFLGNRNFGSGSGILLYQPGAGDVEVEENHVYDNDDGIPLIDADRELILHNYTHDNVIYDGIFADADSTRNLFKGNVALRNEEHDCHDDSRGDGTAGTANSWKENVGVTQTPEGICKPPRGRRGDDGDDDHRHKSAPFDGRWKGAPKVKGGGGGSAGGLTLPPLSLP